MIFYITFSWISVKLAYHYLLLVSGFTFRSMHHDMNFYSVGIVDSIQSPSPDWIEKKLCVLSVSVVNNFSLPSRQLNSSCILSVYTVLSQAFRDAGFTGRSSGAYAAAVNENMVVLHAVLCRCFHTFHTPLLVMGIFGSDRIHGASLRAFETFDALVVETVGVDILLFFPVGR